MNMSASQCSSSECESGWTLYLDQSSISRNQYQNFGRSVDGNNCARVEDDDDDDDEEDLSMVSDASSGPPHYCEDDEEYCFNQFASSKKNKSKMKVKECSRSHQQYSHLDDTASSPHVMTKKAGGRSNDASIDHVLEFSQGFSATHFKGKSSLKQRFGFFQSEKSGSKEPGEFQGRKWK